MAFSYVSYTGNGSTTDYTLSFPYLDPLHISVFVNTVSVPFIFINLAAIRITTPPSAGTSIQLRRYTPKVSIPVNFTDGSNLLERDLDTLVTWALYQAQEAADVSTDLGLLAGQPLNTAVAAAYQANVSAVSAASSAATAAQSASQLGTFQVSAGTPVRPVQSRLKDTFHITDFNVKGDWNGTTGTNDTAGVQAYFTQGVILTKAMFVPRNYYLVDPIQLGDPSTSSQYSSSGQAAGFYSIQGESRLLTTFFASDACQNLTVLTRRNLAGMTIRGLGVDGRGKAATGIDLSWVYQNNIAPSCQNIIEDIQAANCTTVGINLDGMHDSKISGIRTIGCPIGLSLIGGGGQLSLSESQISGAMLASAQNLQISQSVLLSGLYIKGNTDNRIFLSGTQVFPLASIAQTPSPSWGFALSTLESGTYGASITLETCFLLGGSTGCITGKFSAGITAKNCVFDWNGTTGRFFNNVTSGLPGSPAIYRFEDSEFRGSLATGPTMQLPTNGRVILKNCYVSGTYYDYWDSWSYAVSMYLGSAGNLTGAGNAYVGSASGGRVTQLQNRCVVDIDLALSTFSSSNSGAMRLGPFVPSTVDTWTSPITLSGGASFPAGYYTVIGLMAAGQNFAQLYRVGPGVNPDTVKSTEMGSSSRISGSFSYRLN